MSAAPSSNQGAALRGRSGPRESGPAVRIAVAAMLGLPMLGYCVPALAQTPVLVPAARDTAAVPAPSVMAISGLQRSRKFTMAVGKSMIVDLPADASEVFVGNPQVANAVVRSARRLYVMAVGKGQTTIFAMNKDGGQIATLEIIVNGRDIGDLDSILKTVLPGNDIKVQAVDDTVILTGSVDSAVDAQRAQDIATAYTGYTAVGAGRRAEAEAEAAEVPGAVCRSRPARPWSFRARSSIRW